MEFQNFLLITNCGKTKYGQSTLTKYSVKAGHVEIRSVFDGDKWGNKLVFIKWVNSYQDLWNKETKFYGTESATMSTELITVRMAKELSHLLFTEEVPRMGSEIDVYADMVPRPEPSVDV